MRIRVVSYIDGLNLYYAMKKKGWRRFYWLNLMKLGENLLLRNQFLASTKYFTSEVRSNFEKWDRQWTYLNALKTLDRLEIIKGRFLKKKMRCNRCNQFYSTYEEKMTDVNIAVALLEDALFDNYDIALLISADGDLTKPVALVRRWFPKKRVVVAFPPGYNSVSLKENADAYFTIGRKTLQDSQFPPVIRSAGLPFPVRRPTNWK